MADLNTATQTSSDEVIEIFCQPCDRTGSRLLAHGYCTSCGEHLCKSCYKHHKRHTMSRNHKLLNKDKMPKFMNTPRGQYGVDHSGNLPFPCPKHPKEPLAFFCCEHEELFCGVCCSLEEAHEDCKVYYTEEISQTTLNGERYKKFLRTTEFLTEYCRKGTQSLEKSTQESEMTLEHVIEEVRDIGDEMKEKIDKMVDLTVNDFTALHRENTEKVQMIKTVFDEVSKVLESSSDSVKQLNASQQGHRLFLEIMQSDKQMKLLRKSLKQLEEFRFLKRYRLQTSEMVRSFLQQGKQRAGNLKSYENSLKLNISPTEEIEVKTVRNRSNCHITGMALLSPENMIIIDKGNEAIKLVNTKTRTVSNQVCSGVEPGGVAKMSNTQFAVTLTDLQKVQIYSVTKNNKIIKKQSFDVDGNCLGIAYYHSWFVVSYVSPGKLQILSITGKVLRTLNGESPFLMPEHVAVDSRFIYVSDSACGLIKKIDWQGKKRDFYNAPHTAGIALTSGGYIYLCNSEECYVAKASPCDTRDTVLNMQGSPNAICLCEQQNKLYISVNETFPLEKEGNFLQVLQL